MDECSVCGEIENLKTFTQMCVNCNEMFEKFGDLIKKSDEHNRLDTLFKRLIAAFADSEVYISIEVN